MRPIIIALAAGLSLSASSAFAATLTGDYTVTSQYSNTQGGPSVTDDLSKSFSENLTLGTELGPTNFFTLGPAGSCSGSGCKSGTETDMLTVKFTDLSISGINLSDLTETATFTAKYSGSELSCAKDDGSSPPSGETDCVVWSGALDTYNGSTVLTDADGSYDLDILLTNATDWNVTPTIGFQLVGGTSVPEPASLGLLMIGLAGLTGFELIRRRRTAC